MAVKVCAGSNCITCRGYGETAEGVSKKVSEAAKKGEMFYCCGGSCIAISKITTIETTSAPGDSEDPDDPRDPDDPKEPGKPTHPGVLQIPESLLSELPLRIKIDRG